MIKINIECETIKDIIPVQQTYMSDDLSYDYVQYKQNQLLKCSYDTGEWSNKIKNRDKCCFICGSNTYLHAHHINGRKEFPDQRDVLTNGIVLCESCHKDYHSTHGKTNNNSVDFLEFVKNKFIDKNAGVDVNLHENMVYKPILNYFKNYFSGNVNYHPIIISYHSRIFCDDTGLCNQKAIKQMKKEMKMSGGGKWLDI